MKIAQVKATPVAVPYRDGRRAPLVSVIVEVRTEDGMCGYGESPAVLGGAQTAEIIENAAKLMIGKDASGINALIRSLQIAFHGGTLHIQAVSWIFAGVELALWDICAKESHLSLHRVWGGTFRDKVEMMGIVRHDEPERMTAEARALTGSGYRTVYTRIGRSEEEDIEDICAIRAGIPDRSKLICADMDQAHPTGIAVSVIRAVRDRGICWIGQPSMRYNLQSMRDVRNRVGVPILSGASGSTMYDALNVIKESGADYLRIDALYDAGYNGARISAGICEAAGIQCVCGWPDMLGIAMAGALQMMAAYPNFSLPWTWGDYGELEDDVIAGGKFMIRSIPYLDVPQGEGTGVVPDPEKIEKYAAFYHTQIKGSVCESGLTDAFRDGGMYRNYYRGT